eukprot:1859307-Pleurochrysis_carterae.AAC.1
MQKGCPWQLQVLRRLKLADVDEENGTRASEVSAKSFEQQSNRLHHSTQSKLANCHASSVSPCCVSSASRTIASSSHGDAQPPYCPPRFGQIFSLSIEFTQSQILWE